MERALAVIEASESAKELTHEAGELAAGVDAELVVLHVTTDDEYQDALETMEGVPEYEASFNPESLRDGARQYAEDVARETLDGIDVDVTSVGAVGDETDQILSVADEFDCDHVFLAGRKRSPAGKAIFGDVTQSVILDFDGAVTVVTE